MENLFLIAARNSTYFENWIKKLVLTKPQEEFLKEIEDNALLSVNFDIEDTKKVLSNGKIQSLREVIDDINKFYNKNQDQDLLNKASNNFIKIFAHRYYKLRKFFDDKFIDSSHFKYGALNLGNKGAVRYGSFCFVIEKKKYIKLNLCFLFKDSLYMVKNKLEFINNCATLKYLPHLAQKKHINEISQVNKTQWKQIICSNDDYIEFITDNNLPLNLVSRVIIDSEYDKKMKKEFNILHGGVPDIILQGIQRDKLLRNELSSRLNEVQNYSLICNQLKNSFQVEIL